MLPYQLSQARHFPFCRAQLRLSEILFISSFFISLFLPTFLLSLNFAGHLDKAFSAANSIAVMKRGKKVGFFQSLLYLPLSGAIRLKLASVSYNIRSLAPSTKGRCDCAGVLVVTEHMCGKQSTGRLRHPCDRYSKWHEKWIADLEAGVPEDALDPEPCRKFPALEQLAFHFDMGIDAPVYTSVHNNCGHKRGCGDRDHHVSLSCSSGANNTDFAD